MSRVIFHFVFTESMDMFSYVREIFMDIRTFLVSLLVIMSLPIVFTYVFGNCVRVVNHKRSAKSYGCLPTSEANGRSIAFEIGQNVYCSAKFSAGNFVLIVGGILTIYWFGAPTPDIRHDVRCFMHRRYRHFASDNQMDPYLERGMQQQIRGFYIHEGEMREKAEYGQVNETRFRVDV
ncbi:hypothetical protein M3Y96_00364500 [Aphelenchoides besseyi]|nr:hypothetical protein M3Y96_00364500 [Aphelenchoides besseyi]